jgi:glycosyltransferase involved in cell wall biosynthesis
MPASHGIALLCTTHSLGGIELNVLRFARWMRARGHRVLVVGSENAPLLRNASAEGLPHRSLGNPRKYGDLAAARRLMSILHGEGLDILQLNVTRDLNLGVLARTLSRRPLHVLHVQHMQFGGTKKDLLHRLQHARLAAWIAPLPWLAAQTTERTTIPSSRVHVIPFGIELDAFDALPSRAEARRLLQLPADIPVLGVVGRLDRGKGQEYLLHAAALLHDRDMPVHVMLVGEDTRGETQGYGDALRRLASDLRIGDSVSFHGFSRSVLPAYAAMDCFVLPSLSETYGMVTIEAMAAGRPVVGTNTGGTPEILRDGESGLLLPPRDPAALADALARLLSDPENMQRIGRSAQMEARARFSHHLQCERYETVYGQLHGA